MNYKIPVYCAYCGKFMYEKDGFTQKSKGAVSHGICDECLKTLIKEFKQKKAKTTTESVMTFEEFLYGKLNINKMGV